ncbi:MAG TPA: universal stress protein [Puia sp.]|nr:universal stress protein [Puia sp.]
MKNIVAAVDFSESSNNAARYAADLAAAVGAELHLVHVLDFHAIHPEVPVPDYVLDEVRNAGFNGLETLAAELKARTGQKINIATDLETGTVERRVRDFSWWKKPFLVVRGASEGETPSIGQLPYPLLIIPRDVTFRQVRNVVIACDAEDIDNGMPVPFEFLRELRDLLRAHFDVLHVATGREESATISFREWRATLMAQFPEIHFISAPTVEEGVNEYLEHHPIDWLVIFPKKGGIFHFHKSLSKNIVLHCPVPVMSIKDRMRRMGAER